MMSLDDLRNKILTVADETLKYAKDLGIPSAEVYVYNQNTTTLTDNKGKVDSRIGLIQGLGVRVADGKKLGFSSSTSFEKEAIKATLEKAYAIAKVSPENPLFNGFVTETKTAKEGILDENIAHLKPEDLINYCNLMNDEVDLSDNRIISGTFGASANWEGYAVGTTEGCLAATLNTSFGANSYFVVEHEGDRKTAGDFVTDREIKEVSGISGKALNKAFSLLGSKKFGGSENLPTIWEPRNAAAFLAFSFFNVISGTTYVEKRNPWMDKLDQQVAVDNFTLVDDGQKPDTSACRAIDSEGTPKQKTTIIKNGVLKSFLFNKMYAEAAGVKSTGNASRGSVLGGGTPYESTPAVGPNMLLIEEIGTKLEEQISEIEKGILIRGDPIGLFTANPVTGDFSVTSSHSMLILNGEIAHSLKPISIAGNYFETLMNIQTIGSDRTKSGWPIDSPSITFKGHTISD